MEDKNFRKYFFWASVVIIVIVTYILISEFTASLLSAFIFAYLVLPVQKRLSKKVNKRVSALIIITLLLLVVMVIGYFIISNLINQAGDYFREGSWQGLLNSMSNYLERNNLPGIGEYISTIGSQLSSLIFSLIASIPNAGLYIFITFFMMYFLLIDWDNTVERIKDIIPFREKHEIVSRLAETTHRILYGLFIVSIIEFAISLAGFWIAGIDLYILFAFFIALFAFIPLMGPALVWIPLFVFNILIGNYFAATVILITGLVLSILIDNFLVHILVGKKAHIHPVIMIMGVIGGVKFFGLIGFIIGPLILDFSLGFLELKLRPTTKNQDYSKK